MSYTTYRLGSTETLSISSTAATSNTIGAPTRYPNTINTVVRIQSDVDCFVLVGPAPEVTVDNGFPLTAGVYEYIDIAPGSKVAAITAGDSGKLYISNASKP